MLAALIAAYRDKEDLISVGAYQSGTDPVLDTAVRMRSAVRDMLCQDPDDATDFGETLDVLMSLAEEARTDVA